MKFKELVIPDKITHSTATYSPGVIANSSRLLFVSGQVALDKEGKVIGKGDIVTQTRHIFESLRTILKTAGIDFNHIIKTNYYITDVLEWPKVAGLRGEYFKNDFPASTMVVVKELVQKDLMLEIEAVAAL